MAGTLGGERAVYQSSHFRIDLLFEDTNNKGRVLHPNSTETLACTPARAQVIVEKALEVDAPK